MNFEKAPIMSKIFRQEEQIIKLVVFSVVREYAASYVSKAGKLDLPELLTNLYEKQAWNDSLA